ncbi:MAG: hypothetical protein LUQ42_04910 [Methanomicrobiales archaeon]|jgi:hypothetical protein|nr:hypothetical protein [Methanomicrobia archaeon]MDD1634346.1 hypothetical protein [Methanomicrobiales archaeon]MDD1647183.1 hypothetical protein [Methanomicrobiales archaeon]MDD1648605.1 hypothetical protein [Methanomicrobiales archaeon]
MEKTTALGIAIACGAAMGLASVGAAAGRVPPVLAGGVLILAFPVGALALFRWWCAGEGEEDIPFLGY